MKASPRRRSIWFSTTHDSRKSNSCLNWDETSFPETADLLLYFFRPRFPRTSKRMESDFSKGPQVKNHRWRYLRGRPQPKWKNSRKTGARQAALCQHSLTEWIPLREGFAIWNSCQRFSDSKNEYREMQSLGGSGKFQGESRTSPGAGRMLGNQHQPGIDQGGT